MVDILKFKMELSLGSKQMVKIDTTEPEILLFFPSHSSFSKPCANVTHNATSWKHLSDYIQLPLKHKRIFEMICHFIKIELEGTVIS